MSYTRKNKKRSLAFRGWFYFRQGWTTYFAFIFAAINTMVVTYYLAIERIPSLQVIFPSFSVYAIIVISIGIPLLVTIGYIHFKRSLAFGSEQDVLVSSNPYMFKLAPGHTIEVVMPLQLVLSELILKIATQEKPSQEDIKKLQDLQDKLTNLIKGGSVGKPI